MYLLISKLGGWYTGSQTLLLFRAGRMYNRSDPKESLNLHLEMLRAGTSPRMADFNRSELEVSSRSRTSPER